MVNVRDLRTSAGDAAGVTLPGMFSRYRDRIERELRSTMLALDDEAGRGGLPPTLSRMVQYHMGWINEEGAPPAKPSSRGKALRPTLCLFACEALSEGWAKALPAAAALEFIHNFSLIHDDIQDGDLERRHQPTVWALWGQAQALVAGNAMRSIADMAAIGLTERGVDEEKALTASSLLAAGYLDMIRGQCLDLAFENSLDIRLEEYLTMIACKTGALIRCGMQMGALVATGEEANIQAFARCGSFLGLAFQIRDDVLGIWGDEGITGKAVGNDVRRKKKSFPIVYAFEAAGETSRAKLAEVYTKAELTDKDVEDVLIVLEELKVVDYAESVTREKADLALSEVHRVALPTWARQEAEELVEFLATRRY